MQTIEELKIELEEKKKREKEIAERIKLKEELEKGTIKGMLKQQGKKFLKGLFK